MIDNILLAIRNIIQFIEDKRGYRYNGCKESTTMGLTIKYKEYQETIPCFVDEFYKKPRFKSEKEVHRWIDRYGNFIGYRSKTHMND